MILCETMYILCDIFYKITIPWQSGCHDVVCRLSVSMTKLSWAHFAALLSFGITFFRHKFTCIAMAETFLSLPENILLGDQNCISWHWEIDTVCFTIAAILMAQTPKSPNNLLWVQEDFLSVWWTGSISWSRVLGLHCKTYSFYL